MLVRDSMMASEITAAKSSCALALDSLSGAEIEVNSVHGLHGRDRARPELAMRIGLAVPVSAHAAQET